MKFNGFGVIAHLRDIGSIELLATSSQVMPVYCDERLVGTCHLNLMLLPEAPRLGQSEPLAGS